jgi:uncharacterized protein (DUF2336 family)
MWRSTMRREGPNYREWSYEELRELASRLLLRDAETKCRRELIEMLGGRPSAPALDGDRRTGVH